MSQVDGAILHPDSVRTVQTRRGPRTPFPVLVDAPGGSAERALVPPPWTSRRAPPDRAPRLRPAALLTATTVNLAARLPRPWLADLLLQLLDAPGLLGGGAGPVTGDRPEPPGRIPAAQGLGAGPSPLAHAPQTPPRPVRVGQGAPASTRSHVV